MFFLLASFMMVSLSQTHMKGIRIAVAFGTRRRRTRRRTSFPFASAKATRSSFDGQYVPDDQVMPRLFQLHEANPGHQGFHQRGRLALHGDVIRCSTKSGGPAFRKSAIKFAPLAPAPDRCARCSRCASCRGSAASALIAQSARSFSRSAAIALARWLIWFFSRTSAQQTFGSKPVG